MKRVLEVVYGFGYGGIRACIMNYLHYLNREEFHVDIYVFGCSESPFTEQVKSLGAKIYFEPENNVRHIIKFVRQLKSFMLEHGPYDVVHANNNLISAWVLLAAKDVGIPIRLSHSHTANNFEGSWKKKAYSYLRRLIIDRVATKKLACGQLAGESMYGKNADFKIVANGISVGRFLARNELRIEELRKYLKIDLHSKVYANVTRMDPPKNHLFAVEVFRAIHEREPNSIFLYGGTTPASQSTKELVEAKIKEYGLEECCRYTGPIMDVEQLYHLTDLWIYCSAYEGLPFGPIELQAASVPIIASDVITKEIDLGLGLVHFLSLKDAPQKWANLAMSLNKKTISPMIIRDAFSKQHFDIEQNVKSLESIYRGEL